LSERLQAVAYKPSTTKRQATRGHIAEIDADRDALKSENETLKAEIKGLKAKLAKLERDLSSLWHALPIEQRQELKDILEAEPIRRKVFGQNPPSPKV
jgi:hypothetical protein